ncbi:UNVERIFIED_CONTAM: LuxR family two component transcriptional regulator [Acetivibrio alkalicellulosi]
MDKIRIILIEDDPDWITSISMFLEFEQDINIIAVAQNYKAAIETCIKNDADVILMDINLSGNDDFDGIYATAEILYHKQIKIIMLTSILNDTIIKSAYSAGAVNYVLKTDYKLISSVIRKTVRGNNPNEILAKDYLRLRMKEILSPLTTTEKKIFLFLDEGKTKKEILDILFISENTLKNHINRILKKLESPTINIALEKYRRKGFYRSSL